MTTHDNSTDDTKPDQSAGDAPRTETKAPPSWEEELARAREVIMRQRLALFRRSDRR